MTSAILIIEICPEDEGKPSKKVQPGNWLDQESKPSLSSWLVMIWSFDNYDLFRIAYVCVCVFVWMSYIYYIPVIIIKK